MTLRQTDGDIGEVSGRFQVSSRAQHLRLMRLQALNQTAIVVALSVSGGVAYAKVGSKHQKL